MGFLPPAPNTRGGGDIFPQAFAQQILDPLFNAQIYGQTNQNSDAFIIHKRSSDVLFHTIGGTKYLLQTGQQHGHLVIFGISNLNSPNVVGSVFDQQAQKAIAGSIRAPLMAGAVNVEVVTINNKLYAAVLGAFNHDGLQMLDITDPANIIVSGNSGQQMHTGQNWNEASGVDIIKFDNKVYAVVTDRYNDSLTMIDITDPSSPSIVGGVVHNQRGANLNGVRDVSTITINNTPYAVTVSSSGPARLQIIDLSNATHPSGVASLNVGTLVEVDTAFIGGKPYAVTSDWGTGRVDIVDLSNPASPTRTAQITSSTNNVQAVDIFTAGSTTYVAVGGENGIQVIDITSPSSPTSVASLGKGWPRSLEHVIGIDGTVINGVVHVATAATLATPEGTSIFRMVTPAVPTITSPAGQNNAIIPDTVQLRFSVSFDRPVIGFDRTDVHVSGTAGANSVTSFSGSGSGPYTFTVPPPPNTGTVTITIHHRAVGLLTPTASSSSFTLNVEESIKEITDWSSTLTIKDLGNSKLGCDNQNSNSANHCSNAMTTHNILVKSGISQSAYSITKLYVDANNNNLHFAIHSNGFTELANYHLSVRSAYFTFAPNIEYGSNTWNNVNHILSFTAGDTASLELVQKYNAHPPTPFTGTPPKLSFFSVSPTTITEGNSATITINLAQMPDSAVTVCITSEPRSGTDNTNTFATYSTDYDLPGSITIPAGQRTATATITTVDDSDTEKNEIFNVVACSVPEEAYPASGADIYQVGSVAVTIRDND